MVLGSFPLKATGSSGVPKPVPGDRLKHLSNMGARLERRGLLPAEACHFRAQFMASEMDVCVRNSSACPAGTKVGQGESLHSAGCVPRLVLGKPGLRAEAVNGALVEKHTFACKDFWTFILDGGVCENVWKPKREDRRPCCCMFYYAHKRGRLVSDPRFARLASNFEEKIASKQLRFRGGGPKSSPHAQAGPSGACFFCHVVVPERFEVDDVDKHVLCRCSTCRRRVCSRCSEREFGNFNCQWCCEDRVSALESARSVARLRACSRNLRYTSETSDLGHVVTFAHVVLLFRDGLANKSERGAVPRSCRRRGGGVEADAEMFAADSDKARMVKGLLLSVLGSVEAVEKLVSQPWVRSWAGWQELESVKNDADLPCFSRRLLRLAEQNEDVQCRTVIERLGELRREGWHCWDGHAHGGNNCLLDSLLLTLAERHILPPELLSDVRRRKRACEACRRMFRSSPDQSLRPCRINSQHEAIPDPQAYLDLETHAPAAIRFFCAHFGVESRGAELTFDVVAYTRFDSPALNPENFSVRVGSKDAMIAPVLRLYNYQDSSGNGYHFDALLSRPKSDGSEKEELSKDVSTPRSAVDKDTLRGLLHDFLQQRGCTVTVSAADVKRVQDAERRLEDLSCVMVQLFQAGVIYADLGMHAARRLAKEWLAYVNVRTQGAGKSLGSKDTGDLQPKAVKANLEAFCKARGSKCVSISLADAKLVRDAWAGQAELGLQLLRIFQDSCDVADASLDLGRQLAADFRRHCWLTKGEVVGVAGRSQAEGSSLTGRGEELSSTAACARAVRKKHGAQGRAPLRSQQRSKAAGPAKRKEDGLHASARPAKRIRSKGTQEAGVKEGGTGLDMKNEEVACDTRGSVGKEVDVAESVSEADEDWFELALASPAETEDPRASVDCLTMAAAELLSAYPCLPGGYQGAAQDWKAFQVSEKHCAFRDCLWSGTDQQELQEHIEEAHAQALRPLAAALKRVRGVGRGEQACWSAYRRALDCRNRAGAPLACNSIDRRCVRAYSSALSSGEIGSQVCFVCARRFPSVKGMKGQIRWLRALGGEQNGVPTCLGLEATLLENTLGKRRYVQKYMNGPDPIAAPDLARDLEDWSCAIVDGGLDSSIICCPEDKRCVRGCSQRKLCKQCYVPICKRCEECLKDTESLQRGPPAHALANDMVAFYAPRELYEYRVTMMEMICASPCFTTMICFSLEKKFRQTRALDEHVHMQRVRQGARGNATTFPLAWERMIEELEALEEGQEGQDAGPNLPRTGEDLSDMVSVILKSGGELTKETDLKHFIHQACVRRDIVYMLIQKARLRGHPAYRKLDMEEVKKRCDLLPVDGVPAEVVAELATDDNLDQVLRQKAASPVGGVDDLAGAARELQLRRPNAVVLENTCTAEVDVHAQQLNALRALAEQEPTPVVEKGTGGIAKLTVSTGSSPADQFQAWYFGVAFAFLFKYCTAMPDPAEWSERARWRRGEDEPRLGLRDWITVMARRVESQLNRDWSFGYTCWNLLFRDAVNLSRTLYAYDTPVLRPDSTVGKLTPRDLEQAAIEVYKALGGTCTGPSGKEMPVKNNFALLKYVPHLSSAARRLVANLTQTARAVPGAQESRRHMRFEIQAMRVRYGVPIFVTITPDEAHQLLYIRMSRTRSSDPVRLAEPTLMQAAGDAAYPVLGSDFTCSVLIESLRASCPNWEQRRQILARDPLATIDGFRVLILLTMKHLFGVNVCLSCPLCNSSEASAPCQDDAGSSATCEGGVFGRCDAVYVALEFQKSAGSPHGHMQLFVQCLHQHTDLATIFRLAQEKADELRKSYLQYASHVASAVYDCEPNRIEKEVTRAESQWLSNYEHEQFLINRPAYQISEMKAAGAEVEAELWTKVYRQVDVLGVQLRKQHHVHLPDEQTGERVPLTGCRTAQNPQNCKHGFPKTRECAETAEVLCPCRLQDMNLPSAGRKNLIGGLHAPRNHAWLNASHPALLAALRCNTDVQLPFRLPFVCDLCAAPTDPTSLREVVQAAQRAQDAQTGYCCDYCAKMQPMAFAELRELQKGHQELARQASARGLAKQGKRHVTRFLSDAYCKGVVRGQAECCNLRAFYHESDCAAAESIKTSLITPFQGRDFLRIVELAAEGMTARARKISVSAMGRAARQQQLSERDIAQFYARRPKRDSVWYLSPYEFTLYWTVVPTRAPTSWVEWGQTPEELWDVTLTPSGEKKLRDALEARVRLVPGKDTRLRREPTNGLLAFPDLPENGHIRPAWLLTPRKRPRCPHFGSCPVPRYAANQSEGNAKMCLTYFRAWTGCVSLADEAVPHAADLLGSSASWEAELRRWLRHLPCVETQQHVGNFLSVYRVRPASADAENSDNDGADDAGALVSAETLPVVLQTRAAARGRCANEAEGQADVYADLEDTWSVAEHVAAQVPACSSEKEEPQVDMKKCLEVARAGASDRVAVDETCNFVKGPDVRACGQEEAVRATQQWLRAIKDESRSRRKGCCNEEQVEFLNIVGERVLEELISGEAYGAAQDATTPLRWVLHGGPGTGKSHVINKVRRELFEDRLHWRRGQEFDVVALQAVMADLLDGDTMHHAFGLSRDTNRDDQSLAKHVEMAKRLLQLRWLFIDEISMVSVELLARLERRCRELVRATDGQEQGLHGCKPFGGLNVIVVGDIWQLEPPKGTFIASAPHEWLQTRAAKLKPLTAQGQGLIWGSGEEAFQGMTELRRCERTSDEWLREVQEQFRYSTLSDDNYAFLHGEPTRVPGSWLGNSAACQNAACQALVHHQENPQKIMVMECSVCQAERQSRALVASDSQDARFANRFVTAPCIFATNVRKTHANKVRAQVFAKQAGQRLHFAIAQDLASAPVLLQKPNLAEEKLVWLQRHDRECGDLCGVLPICLHMPVFLTDHMDRRRKLLRGRRGTVVGWKSSSKNMQVMSNGDRIWNTLPEAVLVHFQGLCGASITWTLVCTR